MLKKTFHKLLLKTFNLMMGYLNQHTGGEKRPPFLDIEKICPQLKEFEENFDTIQKEIELLLEERDSIPNYQDVDSTQKYLTKRSWGNWKVFMLSVWGLDLSENAKRCPKTIEILQKIPNMFQAFISILDPYKSIPPHTGPYNGYLRYHLAIKIPKEDPPTLYVNEQAYQWSEGKGVLWDDFFRHSVRNRAGELRVVLIVDICRPFPLLPHLLNKFILKYIAGPFVLRKRYAKATMKPKEAELVIV